MPTMRGRISAAAVILCCALSASACGRSGSSAPAVPNPFTVIDRFTPKSLGHGLKHFISLAIGADGNLYVTDTSNQVAVISPQGEVLRLWGRRGNRPGEFRFDPHDPSDPFDIHARIAVGPDGRVVVTDPGNHRIQVFTAQGDFTGLIGSFGNGEGQVLNPNDVVFDQAGNLYVLDEAAGGGLLSKFAPDGEFVWRIGGNASTDPRNLIGFPGGVDAHGRLVFNNRWIVYLDTDSHRVVDSFFSGTCDVSVDASGYTYANLNEDGCKTGMTKVYDRTHKLVGEWRGPSNPIQWPPQFGPNGEVFAVASDGSILRLDISLPAA